MRGGWGETLQEEKPEEAENKTVVVIFLTVLMEGRVIFLGLQRGEQVERAAAWTEVASVKEAEEVWEAEEVGWVEEASGTRQVQEMS